jgi:hypothetical protein
LAIAEAVAFYILFIRHWHLRWGAGITEISLLLPGDDLEPSPRLNAKHEVTFWRCYG